MAIENVLSDLIRIKSVNPPGGETEVARYLKHLFDEYQIPNEIIESSPGRGSFLAYLGEGERRLLYLSHTDVVPATGDWRFAPFSGGISNGFVHGRGALDCKGLVAAEACAVIHLARSTRLGGKLIFAATADEETGGVFGVKYLIENFKHKIVADFAINEGAWEPLRIGDKACHFIQVGEKGIAWTKLKATGVSSHGSLPMLGDNAVVRMAKAINGLAGYQPKITLIPEVKKLVRAVAELEGLDSEVDEENVGLVIQGLEDKILAGCMTAITRMTVSPNVVHGGVATNIVPDSCEAAVDIRFLPGYDKEYIIGELGRAISDVEMEVTNYSVPSFSTTDSKYYHLVSDTMQEIVGDALVLPCISPDASDSRFLRMIGMPCYGITMMTQNLDPSMRQSIHGRNERIDIESLGLKLDFLVRLAREYLGG